jgi:hypothetical protein
MMVNEPCGVVDVDALELSIAARCIRKAFSNCSLTDSEGTVGATALSEPAVVSAALVDGFFSEIVESLLFGDVAASTAEVLTSSNPLALANRMLDGFLLSASDGVHLPEDRAAVPFQRPRDGLTSGPRALNADDGRWFVTWDTLEAVVCFSNGVMVAEISSENADGSSQTFARIATKEKKIRMVLLNSE